MLTQEFDYVLPAAAIAQHPRPRGEARLLLLDRSPPDRHRSVRDLADCLVPGDLLVVNDTRVLPARLLARRGVVAVELLLVRKIDESLWDVLLKPGRKALPGASLDFDGRLRAQVVSRRGGLFQVRFSEPVEVHWDRIGQVPLPPYIKRPAGHADRESYQTVFARRLGSIAAPTAGLHFSDPLLELLAQRGIACTEVTLHVGIGTFKPVKTPTVQEHRMEREEYSIPRRTAAAIRTTQERGGRVVAVGTTVVRALESAALSGCGKVAAGRGSTELFITPGFPFRVVDLLFTNFHLPRSTLLMLVSAFAGRERILAAYEEAIEEGYRFYSYGDAMLVER